MLSGDDETGNGDPSPGSELSRDASISPEERTRWKAALEADTAYAYQLFLQDFPESFHKAQALYQRAGLDEKAWQTAKTNGSESAIEAYVEQFPNGLHLTDAKILQKEFELARAEAERQN